MFDFESLNEINAPGDVAADVEQLSDIVEQTKIVGFEQIADINNDLIADFLKDNIPAEHLKDCPEIKYAPDSGFFKAFPEAIGVFYSETNEIEIAELSPHQTVSDMMSVITHEVGHNEFEQLEQLNPYATKRWMEMYDEALYGFNGFGFVSEYAKTDPFEDFAESYECYVHDPELLKFMSPGKYEFMKNIVFNGREYGSIETWNGAHLVMNKGVSDALNHSVDTSETLEEDLISTSDGTLPVADAYRCFTMIA